MKTPALIGIAALYVLIAIGIAVYGHIAINQPQAKSASNIVFADDINFDHNQLIVCTYLSELNSMECTSIEEFMTRTTEL